MWPPAGPTRPWRANCSAGRHSSTSHGCVRTAGAGSNSIPKVSTDRHVHGRHPQPHSCAARHHGRRLRHAAVAAVARRLSEAVPRAVGQREPVPARCASAGGAGRARVLTRRTVHRRQRRAPLPGAGPAARNRPGAQQRAARTPGPQHRAGADAGCAGRAGRWPGPGAGRHAGRPDRHPPGRVHRRTACGRPRGCRWRHHHPRHHAGPARDRLRLYPRPAGRRRPRGRAVRRKAQPRNRPALPRRRRLLLEQRHVRAARQRLDDRAGTLPPRHRRRHPRRLGRAQDRRQVRAPRQGRVRRGAERVGGLRRHGALPGHRHPAAHGGPGRRLERPGRLGGRLAGGGQGRQWQRLCRRCADRGQQEHPGARHEPAGGCGRPDRHRRRRDAGRGTGQRPRAQPGGQADRQPAGRRTAR
mmetsp:Transcript_16085/g.44739  ORF Transcript_16085/g.44739 Transcript_16085/m.44739 type:complete len:414 (-) Transcript_16085:619-1860(-)